MTRRIVREIFQKDVTTKDTKAAENQNQRSEGNAEAFGIEQNEMEPKPHDLNHSVPITIRSVLA